MNDPYYKSRYVPNPDRKIVWKEIVNFLKPYFEKADTVLDLGAGYCDFINNVEVKNRFAVDVSSEFEKFASDGVKIFRSTSANISIESGSVDVVFSSNLLEHLDDDQLKKTMEEIIRILKNGGLFITMQPNYRYSYKTYFDDPTHKKVFSHVALESFLIANGFKIIKKIPKFLPFSLKSRPSVIPLFSWLVRLYIYSPWKPFAGQMLFIAKK